MVIDGSFLTRTVEFISNHLEGHLVGLTLELPEKMLGYWGEFAPFLEAGIESGLSGFWLLQC
ncbi:MAG: hypothetical protein ABR62_00740 [Actinobacteria bacterium BACL2 MAG-120820-bin50]|uniref:Uncharacterized protein n=4 Tax=ac1 cluster TaxID=1655545 RepID=A0A0R2P3N8_9ACTN|nr:MAG: hypothetical protein ABR60_02330 [Actinobacteria bacterium BACL2 MAG-120802-bin41]KRO31602.1 MAG: hypothetical protein ABR65_04595 [Actinobacteria bacterium BACL2 MAG-121220-bin52]KRO44589.1 MAG: hypothetical protein ABR61_06135 [Actinobacteria bacterium BACL2 MAG-120813-bin23]KRO51214.1 MAG: hypothetical protein ABR62_00740 [Actinobacteria bacterium BACL2 MAG-120820-bin50]KRO74185.1 MAG: hypothetical protein ABS00_05740 [Actinobacteria bacterium BACL2 MAG-120920-bin34]KRP30818.1 MAG: 